MQNPHPRLPLLKRMGITLSAIAVAVAAWGIYTRQAAYAQLSADTRLATRLIVKTVHPTAGARASDLVLPGNVQAYAQAPIYARTNGYLKRWYTDIGAKVGKGQLLAELDAPDLDAQYRQAQADAATAEANSRTSHLTAARYQNLLKSGLASRQDADTTQGDADAKQAQLESAKANFARLAELESFKRIVAPFEGTVTARSVDVGTLVSAASGQELFHIASTGSLRVYVQVPQSFAALVAPGQQAQITLLERPGRAIIGRVTTTARVIDPATRTLLTQLQVENAHGALLAGSFVEVHFQVPAGQSALRLPSNALLFRPDGQYVATADAAGVVQLHKVQLGRDFGNEVEILAGLQASDAVVTNPPDSILAGTHVHIQEGAPK